jgi:hypothetical protein
MGRYIKKKQNKMIFAIVAIAALVGVAYAYSEGYITLPAEINKNYVVPSTTVTITASTASQTLETYDQGGGYPSYSELWDQATAEFVWPLSNTFCSAGIEVHSGEGSWYYIQRTALFFDTSAIPSTATITGASLQYYPTYKGSSVVVQLQKGAFDPPLDVTDYYRVLYSGNYGQNTPTLNTYNTITVTSPSTLITRAGTTTIGLRTVLEIGGTQPSVGNYYVHFNSPIISNPPKLTVTYTTSTTPILYENFLSTTGVWQCYGTKWYAQTFKATSAHKISPVTIWGYKTGAPSGNVVVEIRSVDSAGKPVMTTSGLKCSGSFVASTWGTTSTAPNAWKDVTMSPTYTLTSGVSYAIVVKCTSGTSTNRINLKAKAGTTSPTYVDGVAWTSSNSGTSWTSAYGDMDFKVWG